jgi:hypothetical protein
MPLPQPSSPACSSAARGVPDPKRDGGGLSSLSPGKTNDAQLFRGLAVCTEVFCIAVGSLHFALSLSSKSFCITDMHARLELDGCCYSARGKTTCICLAFWLVDWSRSRMVAVATGQWSPSVITSTVCNKKVKIMACGRHLALPLQYRTCSERQAPAPQVMIAR